MDTADQSPNEATRAKRILVIDDEPGIRALFREVLESSGYAVQELDNGDKVLAILNASEPFDLVITDIIMPGSEGLETIKLLHKQFPKVKIIAMSGSAKSSYLQMAKLLGASSILSKPIGIDTLLESVRSLIGTA